MVEWPLGDRVLSYPRRSAVRRDDLAPNQVLSNRLVNLRNPLQLQRPRTLPRIRNARGARARYIDPGRKESSIQRGLCRRPFHSHALIVLRRRLLIMDFGHALQHLRDVDSLRILQITWGNWWHEAGHLQSHCECIGFWNCMLGVECLWLHRVGPGAFGRMFACTLRYSFGTCLWRLLCELLAGFLSLRVLNCDKHYLILNKIWKGNWKWVAVSIVK